MNKFFLNLLFFVVVFFTWSLCSYADKYENNISSDPKGIDSFISTLTYTQEEEEKRFIGRLKFPILSKNKGLMFNLTIETGVKSDEVGPIGIINVLGNDDSQISKKAKLSGGITWSNYYLKISKILKDPSKKVEVDDERVKIARENNIHHYKKPEDLLEWPPAYHHYNNRMGVYEKKMMESIKSKLKSLNLLQCRIENAKDLQSVLKEIENAKKTDQRNAETYNLLIIHIAQEKERAKIRAIEDVVKKYNLYRFTNPVDFPKELQHKLTDIYDQMILGIWIISLNAGVNYTSIDYLDPLEKFTEKSDSFHGYNLQFKGGLFLNPSELIGLAIGFEKSGKLPPYQTIIQEYTINGNSVIPQTWKSFQVFLDKLEIAKAYNLIFEYRKYIVNYFAFNPFIEFKFEEKSKLNYIDLSLNLFAALDKERKWSIGIQPGFNWFRDEEGKLDLKRPNFSIAFFLTTAFKMLKY